MFSSYLPLIKQENQKFPDHLHNEDKLKLPLLSVSKLDFFRMVVWPETLGVSWNPFVIKCPIFDDRLSSWSKSLSSNTDSTWEFFVVVMQIHIKFLSRQSHFSHVKLQARSKPRICVSALFETKTLVTDFNVMLASASFWSFYGK